MQDLMAIFEQANNEMLEKDIDLFQMEVSERTLCGSLMVHIQESIKKSQYSDYFVDIEYNRNKGGKLKTISKTMINSVSEIITINCDLIVHSRGHNISQDNLIAIEMKKTNRPQREKDKDRERIIALTKDSFDDVWSFDGKTFPKHVCRYKLGIYYEVDFRTRSILLEYYVRGAFYLKKKISYLV